MNDRRITYDFQMELEDQSLKKLHNILFFIKDTFKSQIIQTHLNLSLGYLEVNTRVVSNAPLVVELYKTRFYDSEKINFNFPKAKEISIVFQGNFPMTDEQINYLKENYENIYCFYNKPNFHEEPIELEFILDSKQKIENNVSKDICYLQFDFDSDYDGHYSGTYSTPHFFTKSYITSNRNDDYWIHFQNEMFPFDVIISSHGKEDEQYFLFDLGEYFDPVFDSDRYIPEHPNFNIEYAKLDDGYYKGKFSGNLIHTKTNKLMKVSNGEFIIKIE